MKTIRVGSRDSVLAVAQANLVIAAIQQYHPGAAVRLVTMKTSGDRILDRPLDQIGGKGLFVKELDAALLSGRVDLCVHSYKDLPLPGNPDLPVVAASAREDPRDVLVLPPGAPGIPPGLPIGTSSLRRRQQLLALYPGFRCEPVRGNVQTRLRKLDAGHYGALVLAAAGLKRLGLTDRVERYFSAEEIIPSACQGILAVQGRAGEDYSCLRGFHDADAWDAARAERALVLALGATCASPVASHAVVDGSNLTLSGLFVDAAGVARRGKRTGPRSGAESIGAALARELKPEH